MSPGSSYPYDGVVTIIGVSGVDEAFLDGIADVIAADDPGYVVDHQNSQPPLARRYTVRQVEDPPGRDVRAQVDLEGVREKQIFIEPDRDALEAHRLSVRDLARSLRSANFAISSGDVREGSQKLLVRSVARFTDLEAIENLPIRADGLRLTEVARVRYDFPKVERASRLDGYPAAVVEVFKESEANTIEVTSSARDELERIYEDESYLAASGGYRVLFDQGEVIRDSINQFAMPGSSAVCSPRASSICFYGAFA